MEGNIAEEEQGRDECETRYFFNPIEPFISPLKMFQIWYGSSLTEYQGSD